MMEQPCFFHGTDLKRAGSLPLLQLDNDNEQPRSHQRHRITMKYQNNYGSDSDAALRHLKVNNSDRLEAVEIWLVIAGGES